MTTRDAADAAGLSVLSSVDLRGVLDLVHEWYEAPTLAALTDATLRGVARLVPGDAFGWNDLDLATGTVEFVTTPRDYVTNERADTLRRLIDQHPVVESLGAGGDGSAVTLSDFMTARSYHDHQLYADLYRDLGVEDQLTFTIQVDGHAIGIAVNRDRRNFTRRDRAVVDALRPHLHTAHAVVTARTVAHQRLAALEGGLERAGRWVTTVRDGRVEATSEATQRLLERWFGADDAPLPGPGKSMRIDRDDMSLVVRLVPGDPPVVLFDEHRNAPDRERVRMLGLSMREAEIIALAHRGLGNGEIADALTIALRTVHKHLENAYRKLGVRTRREAAERLFDL